MCVCFLGRKRPHPTEEGEEEDEETSVKESEEEDEETLSPSSLAVSLNKGQKRKVCIYKSW